MVENKWFTCQEVVEVAVVDPIFSKAGKVLWKGLSLVKQHINNNDLKHLITNLKTSAFLKACDVLIGFRCFV